MSDKKKKSTYNVIIYHAYFQFIQPNNSTKFLCHAYLQNFMYNHNLKKMQFYVRIINKLKVISTNIR